MKNKKTTAPANIVPFWRKGILSLKKLRVFFVKNFTLVASIVTLLATLLTTYIAVRSYKSHSPSIQIDNWGIVGYETVDNTSGSRLSLLKIQVMLSNVGGTPVSLIEFIPEVKSDGNIVDTEPVTIGLDLKDGLQSLLDSQDPLKFRFGSDYYSIQRWYPASEITLLPIATDPVKNIDRLPIVINPGESSLFTIKWKLSPISGENLHFTTMNVILKFNNKSFLVIPVLEAFK